MSIQGVFELSVNVYRGRTLRLWRLGEKTGVSAKKCWVSNPAFHVVVYDIKLMKSEWETAMFPLSRYSKEKSVQEGIC